MATDTGTASAAAASPPRVRPSRTWRIVRLVLIGTIVSIALLLIFPPVGLIKDQLAKGIGHAIKRTVTIGDMRLRYWPKLDVEFDKVAVSNPEGMPARDVFRAETIKTRMELLPVLKGRVRPDSLELIKPEFLLEEDAAGARNWVFDTSNAATASAAPAAFSWPPASTITDGSYSFQSAKTGTTLAVSNIDSAQTYDPVSGSILSKGSLEANGETVAFNVTLGSFDAVLAGTSAPVKGTLESRTLKATVDGNALFSAAAEFDGSVNASSPSLLDLAKWIGADVSPSGTPLTGSLGGKVRATTTDVTFAETDVMVNTTSGRFDGTLGLSGPRPKLAGTLASEHVDLGRVAAVTRPTTLAPMPQTEFEPLIAPSWEQLLADLDRLEKGPQAAAAEATAEAQAAPTSPGWSEQPYNLKSLQAADLDLTIDAATVTYGALDLKNGRIKAQVSEGVLDAKLEQLAVGDGNAVGTLAVDSKASPPKAALQLSLTNVAAEPIITEIAGKPLLSGTSNVEITATAAGQNQNQLASTLDGKAHFRMGQGALRGFDVRRMIFEWWKSWSFDLSQKTGFQKLEAQYDIKKGIMRSEPGLAMGGSEVEINSAGTVNVPKRKLNQEIRVKAIPPPTAFPIPVRISGDWAKPSIGIDWAGLFSAGPGLGGPQALAPSPDPTPANVQAAIRRVLAADLPPERLSPEARQMLESLLPKEAVP